MNLSSTIKAIQDIMRKDDGVDGDAQRLGQLTWMLFLKVFDQREEEWEDDNPEYTSPLPEPMRWRNWARYLAAPDGKKKPQITASEIIGFVNNELFPKLKDLERPTHNAKVIRSVFEDANNYMKSGTQLLAVIEKLGKPSTSMTSRSEPTWATCTNNCSVIYAAPATLASSIPRVPSRGS